MLEEIILKEKCDKLSSEIGRALVYLLEIICLLLIEKITEIHMDSTVYLFEIRNTTILL